jgi:hypothetical protein
VRIVGRKSARCQLLFGALWLLGVSSHVRAYGDLFRFNDPAAQGGGGGRWFTGSPADSYGCEVCHAPAAGGQPVFVQGIRDTYQPGATYDLTIAWPASSLHVTGLVEFTDSEGNGAGSVALPTTPLTAAESCTPVEAQVPAAIVLTGPQLALANGRQLVGMQDCGGNVLHWLWTAPAQDVGPIFFAGGLVSPDQRMDEDGDHVTRLSKSIASPAQANYESRVAGGCSASRARSGDAADGGVALALLLTALAWTASRRRRVRL